MSGPVKKSAAIRELHGSRTRPHHSKSEPQPTVGMPDKPVWLENDPLASGLYDEVARYVEGMKVATAVDGVALSMLADQLSIYIGLREQVRREGVIIELEGSMGQMKQVAHPAMVLIDRNANLIIKLLREYGLTAASRANIKTELDAEVNTFEQFMNL